MPTKRIFLASSEELKEDRRAFEVLIGRLNQSWRVRDYFFETVLWENFVDAMSKDGLQKEYNRAIEGSDIFVMLFFTKVGKYTLEEFDTAFADMKAGTGPRIFTYFRNDLILTGDIGEGIKSLLDFKGRLTELNHYVTSYRNTEDLQYQFSRQLEMLYGEEGADRMEIGNSTPALKVGEIALMLTYRQLFGDGGIDIPRMTTAIERAARPVRNTVFQMASERRRETWFDEKRLMERTIPVFDVLTRTDAAWHRPWGQLGFALVDKVVPDWARAKACLDRAVELRGDENEPGTMYYHYNRARCAVHLDPAFSKAAQAPSDPATRQSIIKLLKQARQELEPYWDGVMGSPDSEALRAWLTLNGSPGLR